MKRTFTFMLAAVASMSLYAVEIPAVYPGGGFRAFSPNGNYAIQDPGDHAPMVIQDFTIGKDYIYNEEYETGQGNCVSNTGVVVGNVLQADKAAYWENGKWTNLKLPANTQESYANGVTPDGSMIVGNISPSMHTGYDGVSLIPVYWLRQTDGSYGDPQFLPYPNKDYTNRPPQNVTAVRVSADGKTIAGQMKDYFGMVAMPVVYKQDASGKWNYTILLEDLFHPEGYEIPNFPKEDAPQPQEFMTPAEIAAYNKAMSDWETNTPNDDSLYPSIYDYMTAEEYEAFMEADVTWTVEWENANDLFWKLLANIPNFEFNNVFMTQSGTLMATTDAKYFMDPVQGTRTQQFIPYLIDINSGTYKTYPAVDNINIMVSGLADNGAMVGQWNDFDYKMYNGYILPAGTDKFIPIYDFMEKADPATAKWMEENMTHTYNKYDFATGQFVPTSILVTGVPFCTPDLSLIGFAQYNFWIGDDPADYYGYLISVPSAAGVDEIAESDTAISIRSLAGGDLKVEGDVKTLEMYALNGTKVLAVSNPSGVLSTGLQKGIYAVKVTDGKGNIHSKKLVIR